MSSETPITFELALTELERILRDLENGTTGLEEALTRYERGVGLLRQCYSQLKDAEQKVRLLAGMTEDGGPELRSFNHTASIDSAKSAMRRAVKKDGE
jgi:exodeoxyribonuclease VII small subunit